MGGRVSECVGGQSVLLLAWLSANGRRMQGSAVVVMSWVYTNMKRKGGEKMGRI